MTSRGFKMGNVVCPIASAADGRLRALLPIGGSNLRGQLIGSVVWGTDILVGDRCVAVGAHIEPSGAIDDDNVIVGLNVFHEGAQSVAVGCRTSVEGSAVAIGYGAKALDGQVVLGGPGAKQFILGQPGQFLVPSSPEKLPAGAIYCGDDGILRIVRA